MRYLLDPDVLAVRVAAKVDRLPFQVVLTVKGRGELLVIAGSELAARRPGQSMDEMRAWSASEYADLDPADALAKVERKIEKVDVLVTKGGHHRLVQSFPSWRGFIAWLKDTKEPVERFTVEFPASLYLAAKKAGKRRKEAGTGRGSLRELVLDAVEAHLADGA